MFLHLPRLGYWFLQPSVLEKPWTGIKIEKQPLLIYYWIITFFFFFFLHPWGDVCWSRCYTHTESCICLKGRGCTVSTCTVREHSIGWHACGMQKLELQAWGVAWEHLAWDKQGVQSHQSVCVQTGLSQGDPGLTTLLKGLLSHLHPCRLSSLGWDSCSWGQQKSCVNRVATQPQDDCP